MSTVEQGASKPQASRAWRKLRQSWSARFGACLVCLFCLAALLAGVVAPYGKDQRVDPSGAQVTNVNSPPSSEHWLGTDSHERDVLTRVMYGTRLSLLAGVFSILLAICLGTSMGAIAGYFGGWIDAFLMRAIDVGLAFPSILIALLVMTAWGRGWMAVIIAVGLINVPVFARQVRATVLTVRNLEYVLASRAAGASSLHILYRVILPALISPLLVLATLGLGSAILEVAGLTFLGVAGGPGTCEWGSMLSEAQDFLQTSFWPALAPGVAISLTILGFNLLGDGLRDALDPHLQSRGG